MGLSSCTAGKVLLSFQTGVAELCNDSFNRDKDQVNRQDWHLCSHLLIYLPPLHEEKKSEATALVPFLLQGSEVFLEGRADLAEQLHQ